MRPGFRYLVLLLCGALACAAPDEESAPASRAAVNEPAPSSAVRVAPQGLQTSLCGDMSGLQANAPWPMHGGCPSHAAQSSSYGATTNVQNWERDFFADMRSSAAISADGTIYVGSDNGSFYAIRPSDGAVLWSVYLGNRIRSSPAIAADGTIYVGSDANRLHAISPMTRTQVWSFDTFGDVSASPVVGGDGTIYIGSHTGWFYALRPDGTKKWEYLTGDSIHSSAAIGPDGTIYFGSDDNGLYALHADGTLKWRQDVFLGNILSSPAVGPYDRVYVGSDRNMLHAYDTETGALLWERDLVLGDVRGSPAIDQNGVIYIGGGDQKLHAFTPDGEELWSFATGGPIVASPVIDRAGRIYFGSNDDHLYAVSSAGELLWRFATWNNIATSPAIAANGAIIFGGDDNKLHSVGVGTPRAEAGQACAQDIDCAPGLICGRENGERFGLSAGTEACWVPSCEDGVKDADEEQVDCGGPCGTCSGVCSRGCALGESVPPDALDVLDFEAGAFIRGSLATYTLEGGQIAYAEGHQLRYLETEGGVRMALFEGKRANHVLRSEEIGHAPEWFVPDFLSGPPIVLSVDSGTAPDGQLSADRLQAPSGGIPAAIQQAENFVVPGSLSAYLKNAASGEGQTRLVLVDPELTQLYASPDAWALPAEWTRFDKPTDPASTPLWVTFSHLAQWPIASLEDLLPVLPDASYYLWGVQWEAGLFPSSYIPTNDQIRVRNADRLVFEAAQVPAWMRTEMWQFEVVPLHASSELIDGDQFVLFSFGGAGDTIALAKEQGAGQLRITTGGVVRFDAALAWDRGQRLTVTVNPAAGTVQVSGGELSAPSVAAPFVFADGFLRVGGVYGGASEAFAAISEPRAVEEVATQCVVDPDCSVCGDGVVDADRGEECDPALDVYCSAECTPSVFVDLCPDCRSGHECPAEPNGAAFGLDPSNYVCWPAAGRCPAECGSSYDAPCGKCIVEPDCSSASCGAYTPDGTGNICKQVCSIGQAGCLLAGDCEGGSYCMPALDGGSVCSPPLSIGDLTTKYREPQSMPDGTTCYVGPLCNECGADCESGLCSQVGECLAEGPKCMEDCARGCDPQGTCLDGVAEDWPDGQSALPSDAVPPPKGALSVSDSGQASYVIPLTLPDGASGHRPELAFVYNSSAGDGVLGRGWSLSGMSAISVCEASPRVTSTYRGGPSLCLDGEPLLAKEQSDGGPVVVKGGPSGNPTVQQSGTTYFTGLYERGYVVKGKYTLWQPSSSDQNPFPSVGDLKQEAWVPGREFTVHHEDGRTLYYGHATDDEYLLLGGGDPAMGPSSIRQWLLRRVTDRFGNAIDYRYQKAGVTMRGPELYAPESQGYVGNPDGTPVERPADAEAVVRWIGYNGGSAEISFHYVGDENRTECSDPFDPYCQLATDLQLGRWHGGPLGRLLVLSRVDIHVGSHRIRSYGMGYTTTSKGGIRLLSMLQECGFVGDERSCAPPVQFDYGDPAKSDGDEMAERLLDTEGPLFESDGSDPGAFVRYAQPYNLVFDADGDGTDDFASFDEDGALWISSGGAADKFVRIADTNQFPTYFNFKPREQGGSRPFRAVIDVFVPVGFVGVHKWDWLKEGDSSLIPLPFDVQQADVNQDGLTDIVMWGLDPSQHVRTDNDQGGIRDCGDATILCGTASGSNDYMETYPLGVWVYEARMQDGKLSYSRRRILHEGYVDEEPGLAALLPGLEGKNDYPGVRVSNGGPEMKVHASMAAFDYNDDGQLDFLYCTDHEDGYGILAQSSFGLVHPDVKGLMEGNVSETAYSFIPVPGASPRFCAGAQAIRTRQGRTDLWSPTSRLVLAPTAEGPALFAETTFGDLDFDAVAVRQIERNGDGLPDLVFQRSGSEELEFWLNTGTGFVEGHAVGFQPATTIRSCDYKYLRDAAIVDIDGNGIDDLVIPSCEEGEKGSPGSLKVHYMHPAGDRHEELLHSLGDNGRPNPDLNPYAVWPGDFDGDGDIDILRVSARWTDPWRYEVGQLQNTTFSGGTSWNLLTRVHSTPVAGTPGSETLISYVAGNGYQRETSGSIDASCSPAFWLEGVQPPVAGQVGSSTGRTDERAPVYARTDVAGGCGLGSLATCAPRLPFPVVTSYVERTADLAEGGGAWAECSKTQMFYENAKTDYYHGFVGFEQVTRRHLVPGARRATETTRFDLSFVPLERSYMLRPGEQIDDIGVRVVSRLYARPFADLPQTQWTDKPMPSGATRTTVMDFSHALIQRAAADIGPRVIYAQSRLPDLRAISNEIGEVRGNPPALMVVPVVRQNQVLEGDERLSATVTWWLRNGAGFVDNELSLSSGTNDLSDLLVAIGDFADQASQGASGDLDHDAMAEWFGDEHDASTVHARLLRQADADQAPDTWEGRIGWFALAGSERTTMWARPLNDDRQDVRRWSQSFGYDANGAPSTTTLDIGESKRTRTVVERASTGAVKEMSESAVDEWNGPTDNRVWSFDVDEYGLYTVSTTNPIGHVATTRFDYASGQPVRTEDPDGVITRASYDAFGRLESETVEGAETSLSYVWESASPITVTLSNNPTGVNDVRVNASYRVVETMTRVQGDETFTEVSAETWLGRSRRTFGAAGPAG